MITISSIISGIPYDNYGSGRILLREHNYQSAIYVIFTLAGQQIETEVHCSTGRADCVVHTDNYIYLFEFKLDDSSTPEEALNQIKNKDYANRFKLYNKTIIGIGVSFDNTKKTVKDWIAEEIG